MKPVPKEQDTSRDILSLSIHRDSTPSKDIYSVTSNVPQGDVVRTISIVLKRDNTQLSVNGLIAIKGSAGFLERKFQVGVSYALYSQMREKILKIHFVTLQESKHLILDFMKFVSFTFDTLDLFNVSTPHYVSGKAIA